MAARSYSMADSQDTAEPEPPVPNEALRAEVEHESPEGEPGDADVHGRHTYWVVAAFAVLILVAAVLLALLVDRTAGVAVGALALLLLCLNPAVWGSLVRAGERKQAEEHLTGKPLAGKQR